VRGRPVIQWIVFAILWAFLLYPLIRVTTGSARTNSPVVDASETIPTWVNIRFSNLPKALEIRQINKSLWLADQPEELEHEQVLPIMFEELGAEFMLKATLSDVITAIEVTVTPDGFPERSKTIWADGDVEEVISFDWSGPNE